MKKSKINGLKRGKLTAWLKFFLGITILVGVVWFFTTGYTPPGVFGEVLRHNQVNDIDASPIFYGDVENMTELEEGLKALIEENKKAAGTE